MHLLPVRLALLLAVLAVVAACGAPAPVATPTPTLAPAPTPAPALTPTPTPTPTPAPDATGGPSQGGQSALLLQRAEQVGMELIEATREGCAFSYEVGEYRSSRSGAVEGKADSGVPYGRVARTTVEFGPDGRVRSERQSVTGLQSPLSSGGGGDSDLPAWLDEQIAGLAEMLARGRYVGESSFRGRPSLRYEMRVEGGAASLGAAGSLFVFDYVVDNPFIRGEHQYAIFPDGNVQLERQWATSEFGVEGCAPEDEAARAVMEAVAVEIERNARAVHDRLTESIDAGCALTFTMESGLAPPARRVEGDDARDLLSWFVAIAGIANPGNADGDDGSMGAPADEYSYAGETELFGRAAVRFEHSEVRASESGLTDYLTVLELVRENPLLSRAIAYGTLLPDGAPSMVYQQTVSSIAADCG